MTEEQIQDIINTEWTKVADGQCTNSTLFEKPFKNFATRVIEKIQAQALVEYSNNTLPVTVTGNNAGDNCHICSGRKYCPRCRQRCGCAQGA